ncbi:acetylglutamate kinase [Bacillus solimangrovi]|uniref:Acetylglutamate kinase n=1 Tax=Bacillus solimangrovi TaxID=1305675 RepID=A0A1E5LC46_9BACI|nr:acetylglutamate kinase [Bacillus solimangrovi]OEH91643.1 acetylglutamate kinase [Bacillus solimangrovi]
MNETIVIKCGGSTLEQLSQPFFESVVELKNAGKQVVLVHGGGPEIKNLLTTLQIESSFVNGLRQTSTDVLDAVLMTLAGKVNKQLVSKLQRIGFNAFGCTGIDGAILKVTAKDKEKLGFVGEIADVNGTFLKDLLKLDMIPVLAPLGLDDDGQIYNINADSVAGAVANELKAKQLLFVTDVDGIMKEGQLIAALNESEVQNLIEDGTIYGGMIPKVEAALLSLTGTLNEVVIVNGKGANVMKNGDMIGTKITKVTEVV